MTVKNVTVLKAVQVRADACYHLHVQLKPVVFPYVSISMTDVVEVVEGGIVDQCHTAIQNCVDIMTEAGYGLET